MNQIDFAALFFGKLIGTSSSSFLSSSFTFVSGSLNEVKVMVHLLLEIE